MLLAIDIGNTNTTFGVFQGTKLVKRFDLPTVHLSCAEVKKGLGRLKPCESIVCSVVPRATRHLAGILRRLRIRLLIIGKDAGVPIKNLYRRPSQVGQDRLVNAYGAVRIYGAPIIIVDFGTAITFDVVSKRKEYGGGLIVPGLKISLEALSQRTALLPELKLSSPREWIGRDTKSSMLSGIVYGFASLTDQLLFKLKKRVGKNARVIGTGGDVRMMARYCRGIDRIDPTLTLKGLNLIHAEAKKNT